MHAYRSNNDSPGRDEMMSFKQAAEYIGVRMPGFFSLIQLGFIPGIQATGKIRLSRKYIDSEVLPKIARRSEGFDDLDSWLAAEQFEMEMKRRYFRYPTTLPVKETVTGTTDDTVNDDDAG